MKSNPKETLKPLELDYLQTGTLVISNIPDNEGIYNLTLTKFQSSINWSSNDLFNVKNYNSDLL